MSLENLRTPNHPGTRRAARKARRLNALQELRTRLLIHTDAINTEPARSTAKDEAEVSESSLRGLPKEAPTGRGGSEASRSESNETDEPKVETPKRSRSKARTKSSKRGESK